ncbi:F-box protein [Aspergillus alliaceus]|uniref:F-box protein n=1 Tax=Petromyces alliaceus TaxID=209559 RepID=UPI0012A65C98|nr:uncharacterized protein BDW43DRAFT_320159 [Aspergillus alliaceus]KAB8232192.1 hypothetical protein BDW43DRAFT_320159 [Aspergillus alliaceus]
MLSRLPPEIVYSIATYIHCANDLVHVSQTCRRLHEVLSAENWRIFRIFIQNQFPGFVPPSSRDIPFWKDAAQALTSRSRALDRHSIISRFVVRPLRRDEETDLITRTDNPTLGYRPAIDSYEFWNGNTWADRKEVLAWGAGHEIVMRIRQYGEGQDLNWIMFNDLDTVNSHDDICGLHLLKPGHYLKGEENEHLIFGRMRGELLHLAINPREDRHDYVQRFKTSSSGLDHIDLSEGSDPILAAHNQDGTISFYNTTKEEAEVQQFGRITIESRLAARNKCSKFLSPNLFALGTGHNENALAISSISSERLALEREFNVRSLNLDDRVGLTSRTTISAIAPLCGQISRESAGNVFLAAWGDLRIRLHDVRSNRGYEYTYEDPCDQNQIYCLLPFGHDRFLAGAGGDAVVKIFDLRMPKTYSYTDARVSSVYQHNEPRPRPRVAERQSPLTNSISYPRKDLNIFLFYSPPLYINPMRRRFRASSPYRGAIYSLSSPSPLSPTVYAGVTDGIVRLDFASTDDLTGPGMHWYRDPLDLSMETLQGETTSDHERVLELSGYERPEPGDTTTTSKLRSQQRYACVGPEDVRNELLTGWDRRWKPLERSAAWRRQD